MGWWPFSKKREYGDRQEAKLLEKAKINIEGVRAYLPNSRKEAIKVAQSALSLFDSPEGITNPRYIEENKNLMFDIESLIYIIKQFEQKQMRGGFGTPPYDDSMRILEFDVRRIIKKINGLLRAI